MTQRRLRPSQGGKFHEPIYPSDNGVRKEGWDLIDLWTPSDLAHFDNGKGLAHYGDLNGVEHINHIPSYAHAARLSAKPLYDEPAIEAVPYEIVRIDIDLQHVLDHEWFRWDR